MTPKDRRKRLFKDKKPIVRPIADQQGNISPNDQRWLFAAYKESGGESDDPQTALNEALNTLSQYDLAFFIEDRSRSFRNGYGVVGLVVAMYNGWVFEPHVIWFPWAKKINKLRGVVSVLMFCRYSKDIGVAIVKSLEETRRFFKVIKKYAPIYGGYKIPHGDCRGDEYIYYVRGKKNALNS